MKSIHDTPAYRVFSTINMIFLSALAIVCLLPIVHIFAVSLSSQGPANANLVGLWPVDFTTAAYQESLRDVRLLRSVLMSVRRVAIGVPLSMALTIMCAFPLSFEKEEFPGRNVYMWVIFFTMLFSGGLIPYYMLINMIGIMDTVWALVLPGISVFNVIVMMNFMRQLPHELRESAMIDGATFPWVLIRIILPLSMPVIATLVLFSFVGHWNSWFDGMIYTRTMSNQPLQTYIQTLVARMNTSPDLEEAKRLAFIARRSMLFAKLFLAMVPIMVLYPYLQKYYQSGLVLGSVKG